MERKEAIETLERLLNKMKTDTNVLFSPEVLKALEMAIQSLKVDEAYQLDYEKPSGKWGKDGECPYCGYIQQWKDDVYCGHCGAKMVEEQGENTDGSNK